MTTELPQTGVIVKADVEHCTRGVKATIELIAVIEDDVSWRRQNRP